MPILPARRLSWRRAAITAIAMISAIPAVAVAPQPVRAAVAPPVLTILSTSSWREPRQIQALHVVGEVRNDDASRNAQNVMLDCRLLDASNAQVAQEVQAADAGVLIPGEKSPFDVLFLQPPAYDHYSCTAHGTATVAQPDHNFDAAITTVTTDSTGRQVVSGTVKNRNTVAVSLALLYFTFYKNATDPVPQTIAEGQLWVNDGYPLAPGSVTAFSLTRYEPAWNGDKAALLVEAPTPVVSFTPPSVAVSQVKTTTSDVQLVSLTNVGTGDLHVSAMTLGGAHPTEWAESDTCVGVTVAPFGSCSISLTFTPADVGDRSATLQVTDDANLQPQIFTLTGTGTDPRAVPTPNPLAFGPQVVGATTADRPLTVSNPGIGSLHIKTATLSGANAADFAIKSNACANAPVAQGSSCLLQLNFQPSALGPRSATLTITDDALDSPQLVTLSGTGVASQTAFDPPSRAYSFSNQKIATTSGATSVTVTNKGTTTLNVASVCSSAAAEFTVAPNGCVPAFSLAPGALRAVPITFTPAQTGVRSATLTFTDDAPDSPQVVTLSGTGTFGGQYHSLAPTRIYDSRGGAGPLGAGLRGAPARTVPVTGVGGVRADAIAVVLNVTVTDTTASSFLTVYPTGVTPPTASNLNWLAGQTVPNLVEVGVGSGGSVDLFNAAGSADVIFDVAGYVTAEADAPGPAGFFNPVAPARVLDTRSAIGAPTAPVTAGHQVDVQLTGVWGVPTSGVAAVVLYVTVTGPTAPSFLTVFPTGATPPAVSNLNFVSGQTVPNRVIVKVGSGGKVSFYNAAGQVNVIADVGGWFSDASPGGTGAGFNSLTPTRILDTRNGTGGFNAPLGQNPIALTVSGVAGIPGSGPTPPTALVLNVTVANPTAASFLTLWPDGSSRPNASDLNFLPGQTTSNLVVVKVSPQVDLGHAFQKVWKLAIFNAAGTTDVIIDVVGWYS